MFNSDVEELFNEEEFIKTNLSFLIESDDDCFENSDNNFIDFLSYGQEHCIYSTAAINSKVRESWSSTSFGSISSVKEAPTKFFNINIDITSVNKLCTDSAVTEVSRPSDFCLLEYIPKSHIISPVSSCIEEEVIHVALGSKFSEMQISSNKIAKMAPITELNMMSQASGNTVYEDPFDTTMKSTSQCALAFKDIEKNTPCETALEQKPKTLTLADFLQKPTVNTKFISNLKSCTTSSSDEDKENNFCKFCFKNGELAQVYTSHVVKSADGIVVCPILRKYVCDLCGQSGDSAHTRKYCRLNSDRFQRKPLYRRLSNGVLTSSHNHK